MMSFLQTNEDEHRSKAAYWMQNGRPDYAAGSIRKAAKWNEKRRVIDYQIHGPYPKKALEALMDEAMQKVSKEIADEFVYGLYGN